ncbi:MAG: winged helix DNA-binding domain-containing protein [Kineosporiaceae bacterium]|nr:winged helix DNA-binding domain-containing protein [Kineosporiaceae bacterium]
MGPRFNVYVIAAQDVAPFTLGRHPDDARGRRRAEELADAVTRVLAGRELAYGEVSATLGIGNAIRYATTTGRLAIRWHGARAPMVRAIEPPQVEPGQARRDLARRYLHVYGPTDAEAFAQWAGISAREAQAAFAGLDRELLAVHTPPGRALPYWTRTAHAPRRGRPGRLDPRGGVRAVAAERGRVLPGAGQRPRTARTPRPSIRLGCGPRASGPAPSWCRVRSSAPGVAPTGSRPSRRGGHSTAPSGRRSSTRRSRFRYPGRAERSPFAGPTDPEPLGYRS